MYIKKNGINAERILADRFSIGDENKVVIILKNNYVFSTSVIDELPIQFQERKWMRKVIVRGSGDIAGIFFKASDKRGVYI